MPKLYKTLILVGIVAVALPAAAKPLHHNAENQVPVVITDVIQQSAETLVLLKTQVALTDVCWARAGPNRPYLLSAGRRYRLVGGDNFTDCPERRDYEANETMILRFEPLAAGTADFSLVEGEGGEIQMLNSGSSQSRYWNFLRVNLR